MLCFECKFAWNAIIFGNGTDAIRRQQNGTRSFFVVGSFVITQAIFRQDKIAFFPQFKAIVASFIKPAFDCHTIVIVQALAEVFFVPVFKVFFFCLLCGRSFNKGGAEEAGPVLLICGGLDGKITLLLMSIVVRVLGTVLTNLAGKITKLFML